MKLNFGYFNTPLKFLLLASLFISLPLAAGAQFDQLIKKTSDKLADEVSRMAVEKLSDIIAQKAAEQIEKKFDQLLMEAMEGDTAYQSPYDRDSAMYNLGRSYGAFMQGLNDAADLPPEYTFDLSMLVEITDDKNESENTRWYFSRDKSIMGIQAATSEKESQLIVWDMEKDVVVMYKDDGKKKTAQAIPNMMKLAGNLADKEEIDEQMDFTITPKKKKRKIAGYKCDGFDGKSEDNRFEAWTTNDLGIQWKDTFGPMMRNFTTTDMADASFGEFKGMTMASDSYEVESGKLISSFLTKEVDIEETVITNADYEFGYENNQE